MSKQGVVERALDRAHEEAFFGTGIPQPERVPVDMQHLALMVDIAADHKTYENAVRLHGWWQCMRLRD